MFQTAVLASGSKGNSILVKTENTKILIDAGLSGIKISEAIRKINLNENKLKALIISHEHSDHISGAGVVCRKYKIPLFITKQTYLVSRHRLGKIPAGIIHFENGETFQIGDLQISTFPSSHDVVDGVNFVLQKQDENNRKLAIATDLGYSSRLMLLKFQEATTIILESNHDEKMLLEGPYPWELKQRVKSRMGHLSNEQAVAVISQIIHPGLKNIILAHLSEINNKPEIAKNLVESYLKTINLDLNLIVSSQYEPTPIIDV
ncbi:MAG: MBL fold metallo-hydrolase [Candidatus Cloacimonas sp. 4484_275]|nr:MAG: MBL fold metallo-hydrolase [Candidatus Cloacimonas sp. 4484_275]